MLIQIVYIPHKNKSSWPLHTAKFLVISSPLSFKLVGIHISCRKHSSVHNKNSKARWIKQESEYWGSCATVGIQNCPRAVDMVRFVENQKWIPFALRHLSQTCQWCPVPPHARLPRLWKWHLSWQTQLLSFQHYKHTHRQIRDKLGVFSFSVYAWPLPWCSNDHIYSIRQLRWHNTQENIQPLVQFSSNFNRAWQPLIISHIVMITTL